MLATALNQGNGRHAIGAIPPIRNEFAPRASPFTVQVDLSELATHRADLLKFAHREMRNPALAEDAVQETLLAALQGAERFRGGAALRTWLIGILKHKIVDHHRRSRREVSIADDADRPVFDEIEGHEREGTSPAPETGAADWGDPEATFARERFFEVLERGMARLPAQTARAFHMREVLGMSTDEICQTLGITPSHCAVLLYRARMALREFLQKEWFGGAHAGA
jgi:RNA polymerase sigma-70 factor (ECF subfamily)